MHNNIVSAANKASLTLKVEILDTYEGMLSLWDGDEDPDGRWEYVSDRIDDIKAEIAVLRRALDLAVVA
jgi:hypothetical protein